jgi:hypothetical protein
MTVNHKAVFELTPVYPGVTFTSADTTALKDIVIGAAEGTRIDMLTVCTNDTAAVNLAFYINDGATDFYIGNVNVPIGSGYTTVARVDALTVLSPSLRYLEIPYGSKLRANCVATMTAAKTTTVTAMGGKNGDG